jgi:ABC-type oligopeptide transport system ATPase subunit
MSAARQFVDVPAERKPSPLLFGLIGPSGSGKTFSALRLATGIVRVTGGEIVMVDTEGDRGLHYADLFKYRHVPFPPPHSSLDYLAAIQHAAKVPNASVVIVDSMSHEHEGVGGHLDQHDAEAERLLKLWRNSTPDKVNMSAWQQPKKDRRKLIHGILQIRRVNFIFCFRAKDKIKLGGKEKVATLGFMPIAGEEFVYELVGKALLMPGAGGVPTWNPDNPGEKMMTKLPAQFRDLFTGRAGKPLDEDTGEQLARWAAGESIAPGGTRRTAPARRDPPPASEDPPARSTAPRAGGGFTLETALNALMGAQSSAGLARAWDAIRADYQSRDEALPLELEVKFNEMDESFNERGL